MRRAYFVCYQTALFVLAGAFSASAAELRPYQIKVALSGVQVEYRASGVTPGEPLTLLLDAANSPESILQGGFVNPVPATVNLEKGSTTGAVPVPHKLTLTFGFTTPSDVSVVVPESKIGWQVHYRVDEANVQQLITLTNGTPADWRDGAASGVQVRFQDGRFVREGTVLGVGPVDGKNTGSIVSASLASAAIKTPFGWWVTADEFTAGKTEVKASLRMPFKKNWPEQFTYAAPIHFYAGGVWVGTLPLEGANRTAQELAFTALLNEELKLIPTLAETKVIRKSSQTVYQLLTPPGKVGVKTIVSYTLPDPNSPATSVLELGKAHVLPYQNSDFNPQQIRVTIPLGSANSRYVTQVLARLPYPDGPPVDQLVERLKVLGENLEEFEAEEGDIRRQIVSGAAGSAARKRLTEINNQRNAEIASYHQFLEDLARKRQSAAQ